MKGKVVGQALELWINRVENHINQISCSLPKRFVDKYCEVLRAGKAQANEIEYKMRQLETKIESGELDHESLLEQLIQCMSIKVGGEEVFLPSFSDECLKEIGRSAFLVLSPFRGLYYGWMLGEIAYLLTKNKDDEALIKLANLYEELQRDHSLQKPSSDYWDYIHVLEETQRLTNAENCKSILREQIEYAKKTYRYAILKIKHSWITLFPYPSRTSTHFYLSGLRFYHYPLLFTCELDNQQRYYVHSTDSGLFKPVEHYGMILNSEEPDEVEEMMKKLEPGTLVLDIENEDATINDCQNLVYFEEWSYLITTKAFHIVSETLDMFYRGYSSTAKTFYINAVSKNPVRKFYFDTGIYKTACLASKDKVPKVSYLTTYKSRVSEDLFGISKRIIEKFLDTNGIEYYLLAENGWVGNYEPLSFLTLIPSRNLGKFTNSLISIREKGLKKIAHGVSSLGWYLFAESIEPEIKSSFEKWEDALAVITSLKDPVLYMRSAIKLTRAITQLRGKSKEYQALIEDVRRNIATRITIKNLELLKKSN
jgi:hypothetical protein